MSGILVLGAGGHGKVIADILCCQGVPVMGFLDDNPALWGTTRLGLPVLGAIALCTCMECAPEGLILGIGENAARRVIAARLGACLCDRWCNAIHPRATVARSVRLGRGVVIMAGAVVNPDVTLGDHTIVNTGATVDHDCVIEDFAHIGPGAHLAGSVHVGREALIGVGAATVPGVSIGDGAIVGAGSVVIADVPSHVTVKGVPARQ